MKNLALTSIVLLLLGNTVFSQPIPPDSLYLGQTPPGSTPMVFELPVSSGLQPVERITITSDGKEIYYGEQDKWPPEIKRIKYFKYVNNAWQGPVVVFEGFVCPALSVNDSIMYMQKDLDGVACTYYSTRTITGWSVPVRLLSTNQQVHYFQQTNLNNYYFASTVPNTSNSDICKLIISNSDTIIQGLGLPINTPAIENDFFIARDESYIIVFRLKSPNDLFISYNKSNGSWTNPKSLGTKINTPNYDCCPFVTNDNKYLFFTRGMSSYYTYWVKVDQLIDSLKYTNFAPYVKNSIPDQTVTVGQSFNYTISDSTFFDDDGNNTLTYDAKLANGTPLPAWLTFDTITRTFDGIPTIVQTLLIKVTATDTAGATASATFKIKINPLTAINQIEKQDVRIFPNPTNGLINISLDALSDKTTIVEISNLEGQVILTNTFKNNISIDFMDKPKGMYIIKLFIDNKTIISKVCIE